jgi:2-keto-4-pentenoate hydratase/2-oxohepta-3-ene-1,7-dioic acid hydratase in catechol pathway
MKRLAKVAGALIALIALGVFAVWATSPDPRFNPATFEAEPLALGLSPREEALTLAQYELSSGEAATMLVTGFDDDNVTGVDLTTLGAARTGDPLNDLANLDRAAITDEALAALPQVTQPFSALFPSAPGGLQHIGTGTNFPEHAEEAGSESVFQFPKFGAASPARTTLKARPGILLDYEVEVCMRFDRDIASLEDFDAAVKGVFLCGDFTDRNALVMMADPDNLDSGFGFSDSKSGPDSYPSGPFLVVPRDWKTFVADIRMTTSLNGEPRQDARGSEMTLDFRALAEKALGDMAEPRFAYGDEMVKLAPEGMIASNMTLMSGTSEGVIFTVPTRGDYIEAVLSWLGAGGPLASDGLMDHAKRGFIASELEGGHFLQLGDTVEHGSNRLGNIVVEVTR